MTLGLINFYRNAIVPKQKLAEEAGRKIMRQKWLDETEKQRRLHAERATWAELDSRPHGPAAPAPSWWQIQSVPRGEYHARRPSVAGPADSPLVLARRQPG